MKKMNEKRFTIHGDVISDRDMKIPITLWSDKKQQKKFCDELNALHEENEQLKQENKEYTKLFHCRNCRHLNYDWYDDGDEFEVCDMGNTERLVYHRFCKDWKRG